MSTILFLNGNIYTMDAAQPRAQALAIDTMSGRILAVGDNDEVHRAGDRHAELVDLRGKTLLPGFIDAHIHLTYAAYRSYYVNAGTCSSEDEVANLVRQRAAQTPVGQWIQGGQWNKNVWPGEQFPTKVSLDNAAPEHPVALASKDGHLLWVNSIALQRAGITVETSDPSNGAILKDSAGEPTGILQEEGATSLVYDIIDRRDPDVDSSSRASKTERVTKIRPDYYSRYGGKRYTGPFSATTRRRGIGHARSYDSATQDAARTSRTWLANRVW